jgi:hypothetical protein
MEVLGGEGSVLVRIIGIVVGMGSFEGALGLLFDLVEADGGLEHEHDFETLAANVGDDTGDLGGLRHALVNGLTQLLDQFAEFLIQCGTSISRPGRDWSCGRPCSYLIF